MSFYLPETRNKGVTLSILISYYLDTAGVFSTAVCYHNLSTAMYVQYGQG